MSLPRVLVARDRAPAGGGDFIYLAPAAPDGGGGALAEALRLDATLSCLAMGEGPDLAGLAGTPGARRGGAAAVSQRPERALALVVPGGGSEPFAQAAITAFADGLPVIGGRAGSLPEIVREGRTGMLLEPGNAAALARGMRWTRENPARMQAMGRAARTKHQKRFSAQENYRLLLAVYNDAIATTPL